MRGVFVTGTDTGAGKSVVAAAICAALAARGERVAAFKPTVTGLEESPNGWPHDHHLLAGAASAGQSPEEVSPWRFEPAVSPHLAAEQVGTRLQPPWVVERARHAGRRADVLVCEGVGGVLVPLTPGWLVRDFARELGLPVLIAARPALGTINHTLLTVEAVRSAGLEPAGIVMTPWPDDPGEMERSNRETVERLARIPVSVLPRTEPGALAAAGDALPINDWL